jgi:hypothetical protein
MRGVSVLVLVFLPTLALSATANGAGWLAFGQDQLAHSGGCRKSSPPGQCCHMQHSTGVVHCH